MTETLAPGTSNSDLLHLRPIADLDLADPIDYHMHTTYTDGTSSPLEMAKAASEQHIHRILFSEHVRHTSDYYPGFVREIRGLNYPGLTILTGVETKALDTAGRLDCSEEIASLCDAIVGSVHSPNPDSTGTPRHWSDMAPEEASNLEFELAMAIVKSSRANILGHPMGMAVTRFNLNPLDRLYDLACACREAGKAFELNPRYCASPWDWLEIVQQAECLVSFGSDAHKKEDVGRAWRLFALRDKAEL